MDRGLAPTSTSTDPRNDRRARGGVTWEPRTGYPVCSAALPGILDRQLWWAFPRRRSRDPVAQFVLHQRFFRAIKHASTSLDCRYRSDVGVVASHKRPLNPHLTRHHQRLTKNRCGETSPPELGAHRIPDVTSDTQKLFRKCMPDRSKRTAAAKVAGWIFSSGADPLSNLLPYTPPRV